MEHRIIDPPRSQFERLLTPLTPGERQLIDFFDEELSSEWEMYIQPHLNGLQPDLVLLNPSVGIAVFEVKDWNLNAIEYFGDGNSPRLMARDKHGNIFSKKSERELYIDATKIKRPSVESIYRGPLWVGSSSIFYAITKIRLDVALF